VIDHESLAYLSVCAGTSHIRRARRRLSPPSLQRSDSRCNRSTCRATATPPQIFPAPRAHPTNEPAPRSSGLAPTARQPATPLERSKNQRQKPRTDGSRLRGGRRPHRPALAAAAPLARLDAWPVAAARARARRRSARRSCYYVSPTEELLAHDPCAAP
jgi:hypothetical protein